MTIGDEQFLRENRQQIDKHHGRIRNLIKRVDPRLNLEVEAELLTFVRIGAELMRERREAGL